MSAQTSRILTRGKRCFRRCHNTHNHTGRIETSIIGTDAMKNAIIAHRSKRPHERIARTTSSIRARPGMRTSASPRVSLLKGEFVARQTLLFSRHKDIRIRHRKYLYFSLERIFTTGFGSCDYANPIFTRRSECFIRNNLRIIVCAILILPIRLRIQNSIFGRSTRIR